MIIESAWGQLFFSNLLGGGTIKFQSGKRFGHRCGLSSVPDFFKSKSIKVSRPP